uniref:Uncharacterized protein n=1 Tax=Parascaris univalens TaxID=6257 RepID=A0A914ZV72_PARUN
MQQSSISFAAQMRVPMIKFIGTRLPRPHFDPASFPPIPTTSVFVPGTAAAVSSQPPVGKIPRGQSIEEWQLPSRLRRQPISAQECAAINVAARRSLLKWKIS